MGEQKSDATADRWRESRARVARAAFEAAHGNPIPDDAVGARWRIEPRVAVTAALAITVIVAVVWWGTRPAPVTALDASGDPTAAAAPHERGQSVVMAAEVVVHVTGAVVQPGVFTLPGGARAADAVDAAGGVLADADTGGLNLARPLTDGEQVHVPTRGERADEEGPVSLNRATAGQLEDLPGIGPVLAQRIVADRDERGPFESVADLARVAGVGDAIVGALGGLATV